MGYAICFVASSLLLYFVIMKVATYLQRVPPQDALAPPDVSSPKKTKKELIASSFSASLPEKITAQYAVGAPLKQALFVPGATTKYDICLGADPFSGDDIYQQTMIQIESAIRLKREGDEGVSAALYQFAANGQETPWGILLYDGTYHGNRTPQSWYIMNLEAAPSTQASYRQRVKVNKTLPSDAQLGDALPAEASEVDIFFSKSDIPLALQWNAQDRTKIIYLSCRAVSLKELAFGAL